jgi:dipeptidyl aminopeptidase/acylaminoacyl peptidase
VPAVDEPIVAPYGSWVSPISATDVASATVGLSAVRADGPDLYWLERRPAEEGRVALVRRAADGTTHDITPPAFNVRTRVHEYGGGAFAVASGIVVASSFADGRLYRLEGDREPLALTLALPDHACRFADMEFDPARNRVVCILEHHAMGAPEATNSVVAVPLDGSAADGAGLKSVTVLAGGHDFFSDPRVSPDGRSLAWLAWDHPHMPWDGSTLWVGRLSHAGIVERAEQVAGGPEESIAQPRWSPGGVLHFVSDRTGWWNLYRLSGQDGRVEAVALTEAEFAAPQWQFGMSTYAFLTGGRIACAYAHESRWTLGEVSVDGVLTSLDLPFTDYRDVAKARNGDRIACVAASPADAAAIIEVDPARGTFEVVRRPGDTPLDAAHISRPRPIRFATGGGLTAHALHYPPTNPRFVAPPGELPPLLVKSHGGPTDAASTAFDPEIQFWTSRGIAVVDVDYGGSSGYGRSYRRRLQGKWGVVDVDDCVSAARFLVDQGLADRDRLLIDGGSAGGYTTLCALVFRDVFRAGASYYGIGDLEVLARDTHKFESRYLDGLVGPYPSRRDLYRVRSPIHAVDRLACPVILFQGMDDHVVPPNQAELIVEALRSRGLPVAYLSFEGEGHGFRRPETMRRSLEAELDFFGRVLGFEIADAVDAVPIENLS